MVGYDYERRLKEAEERVNVLGEMYINAQLIYEQVLAETILKLQRTAEKDLENIRNEQ